MCRSESVFRIFTGWARKLTGPAALAGAVAALPLTAGALLASDGVAETQAASTAATDAQSKPPAESASSDSRKAWRELVELGRRLEDPDPEVRKQAATELALLGSEGKAALWALNKRLTDEDELVRAYAAHAVWVISGRPELTAEVLSGLLESRQPGVADLAAGFLGSMGPNAVAALPKLHAALAHPNLRTRLLAAEAITRVDPQDEASIDSIAELVEVKEPEIRLLAAFLLADVGREHTRRVIPALSLALKDEDPRVRTAAELTLETLGWRMDALPDRASVPVRSPQLPAVTADASLADRGNGSTAAAKAAAAQPAAAEPKVSKPEAATPDAELQSPFAAVSEPAQPAPKERRPLEQGRNTATRVQSSSEAAFSGGLMTFADYTDHLMFTLRMKSAIAELEGNDKAVAQALEEHIGHLRRASTDLRKVTQPNSKVGQADLALARMLAARAQTSLAKLRNDSTSYRSNLATSLSLANEQYQLRVDEYNVGQANLDQLARAAAYLDFDPTGASQDVDHRTAANLMEYQDGLRQLIERAERLEQAPPGPGHEDESLLARFELARTGAVLASVSGDDARYRTEIDAAGAHSARMFETQRGFQRSGTASLFDLTLSWMRREALYRAEGRAFEAPADVKQSQSDKLQELVRLANAEHNLSGRTAADAALVQGLSQLSEIEQLRPAKSQPEAAQPGPVH